MDKETVNELEKRALQGDASAMVKMAKYLLSGGQHPFLDARLLLESAKEAGNNEAAMLLKLIDWGKQLSKDKEAETSTQKEEKESLKLDSIEEANSETLESDEDCLTDDEKEKETDKLDVLLRAQAIYRDWRDSSERDPHEREEAISLFEEAVDEYKNGTRQMDEDLLDGLVLLAQFYGESGDDEKYLEYVKIGAQNGQTTLAYTYGAHLQKTNRIDEAEKYYKEALKGQFTKVRARLVLAMIYLQTPGFFKNHKEEAMNYINEGIELLEKQETISPENYIFYLLKGDYWRVCRNSTRACEEYKKALDVLLKADNAPKKLAEIAAGNLAELFTKEGKHKEAKKYLLKKRELSKNENS